MKSLEFLSKSLGFMFSISWLQKKIINFNEIGTTGQTRQECELVHFAPDQ
jgi:hypothetical protein